jgi:hypothetical protein
VFAAAKAMQELEEANAEAFAVDARDMLDREKVAKLEQATAEVMVDGQKKKLTRLEIEELIKKNLKQIAQIEEEQLEPAERSVRIASARAAARERELTIVGLTRAQWEEQANKIELASLSVTAYDGKLQTALASVNNIIAAWVALKKAQDEAGGGIGGGAGGSNVVPQEKPLMSKEEAKALADKLTATDLPAAIAAKAGLGNIEERINNANTYARNMAAAGKMVEAKSALNTRDTLMGTLNAANARIQAVIDQISGLKRDFNKDIVVPEVTVAPFTLPPVTVTPPDDKKPDPKPDPKKDPKDDPKPDPKDDPKKDPKPTNVNTTTIEGILAASGIIPAVKPGSGGSSGTAWIPMATGGFVSGPGTATSDSIPALLSNGEYVINAKTAGSIGIDMLDAINFGKVPAFAKGGAVNTNTLAGILAASKKPTAAQLLAAAKKQDNKVVNKTLAAKAVKNPPASPVVKYAGGDDIPFLPTNQMFARGKAGEQNLADIPALFVPVLGNVLSANALEGSLERKDYGMAALDALGVIPGFGNLVKGATKLVTGTKYKPVKKPSKIVQTIDDAIAKAIVSSSLKNPKIVVGMTPSGVEGMIRDRKLKNMFELPNEVTDFRPGDYKADRLRTEGDFLGVPANTPASARSTYGTVASKSTLPYDLVQFLSRRDSPLKSTGAALSLFDPRFNKTISNYVYSRQSNIRDSTEQALLSLKPGAAQGTFTLGDSFLQLGGRPFAIGSKADRKQATSQIMEELKKARLPGSPSQLIPSPFNLPYIEAQISAKTNPFEIASKLSVPFSKNNPSALDKLKYAVPGFGPTKRDSLASALKIKSFMAENKVTGIRAGTMRNSPSSLPGISRTAEMYGVAQRQRFQSFAGKLDNKLASGSNIYRLLTRDLPQARKEKAWQEYLKNQPVRVRDNELAKGGLVKPQYFGAGGMVKKYAKGGDVVPSMLTPGEFVMSKYAVQNYGVDKMKALNSGTYNGDSVYNYNLSVNVKSDANPDDIARTVMTQIRQVESQRIRSAR